MWPFKKNLRQRRIEAQAQRSPSAKPSWISRSLNHPGANWALLAVAVFYLGVLAMDLWPAAPLTYRAGQYMPYDVLARVDFSVIDAREAEARREAAETDTPARFRLNADLRNDVLQTLDQLPKELAAAGSLEKVRGELAALLDWEQPAPVAPPATTQPTSQPAEPPQESAKLKRSRAAFAGWAALASPDQAPVRQRMRQILEDELLRSYIVQASDVAAQFSRGAQDVVLLLGDGEAMVPKLDLIALDKANLLNNRVQEIGEKLTPRGSRAPWGQSSPIRQSLEHLLYAKLSAKPMYLYEDTETKQAILQAIQAVDRDPPQKLYLRTQTIAEATLKRNTNSPLAEKGLTQAELLRLEAENEAFVASEPWAILRRMIARALVLGVLTALLATYVAWYAPSVVTAPTRAISLALLLLAVLGVTKLTTSTSLPLAFNPHAALFGVCLASIIIAITYDQRTAMAVGAILAAFLVFQMREDYAMLVVLLAGVTSCVVQLREVRSRSKLIVVSALSAAFVFAITWALAILRSVPSRFALRDSIWAAGAVLLAGLIVQSFLPAIEYLFRIVTGSTLLEWCDASKPLLKRLAMESPGTYNHSLQLGAMCESAAEAIGARGLLARVGAYYHDIGKINKPSYFTENQGEDGNRHDKLSPAMSLLVIIGHVKDGLEMAKQYGLPYVLREFIATHHGTTVMQFFYHAAKERAEAEGEPAPDESQFRYPGPKPRAKEAAILMLADGAESSVRSMSDPTPTRIRQQVHRIVTARLEDGQLDECFLTLREVHMIEESIIKSLCGMYHSRIAYPSDEDKDKRKAEQAAAIAEAAEAAEDADQAEAKA